MRYVDPLFRQAFLDGQARTGLTLIGESMALQLTASRLSVDVGGYKSDDFYDAAGYGSLWGESTLVNDMPGCVFNLAAGGQASAWYFAYPNGVLTVAGGTTGLPYGRPGAVYNYTDLDGNDWITVFYVDSTGNLKRRSLTYAAFAAGWEADETTVAVVGVLDGAACAAIDANTVQVAGYQGNCLWLRRYTYAGGVWTAGNQQIVSYVPNGQLLPQSLGAYGNVVTLHLGGGQSAGYLYQNGTYSAPYALLGTPPDQRVYPWGLSYADGRYVLVVTSCVHGENGRYYAHETRVLSSPDGRHWRDEGPVAALVSGLRNPLPLRGKLLAGATAAYLISPASYLSGNLPAWLGTATLAVTATPFEVGCQHPGLRATQELDALVRPDDLYEPGLRLSAWVDAHLLFRGYLDQAQRERSLQESYTDLTRLTARGPLGRLIGETAYRPVALMDLPGRGAWYTNFCDGATGIAVDGVAVNEGDWTPQSDYRLYSPNGGSLFIPQAYSGMAGYFMVRFQAGAEFGVAFGNSLETDKLAAGAGNGWRVRLVDNNVVLSRMTAGVATTVANTLSTGYTIGTAAELVIVLSPGRIEAILIPTVGAANAAWIRLSYSFLAESETQAWPAQWSFSLYEPRTLAADGSYTARAVYISRVLGCTGDVPWSVGEAIQRVAERAGASLSNTITTYAPGAGLTTYPYVSLVNIQLASVTAGQTLRLKGRLNESAAATGTLLTFQSGYLDVDGVEHPYRADRTGLKDLRVLWYDDVLALYQNDDLILALYLKPAHASGYLWCDATFTMLDLYQPAEAAAWDYNQPAETIMSRLLERRRAYLVECADGTLTLCASPEGDTAIAPDVPVAGHLSYDRGDWQRVRLDDARGAAGLVGVIGMQDTVYVVDPQAPAYGLSSVTNDNPWAYTEEDALKEARLQIQDNRRLREGVQVDGVFDPAIEITDVFTVRDGSQWVLAMYAWSYAMGDEGLAFNAHLEGLAHITDPTPGVWGTFKWGESYWG